MVVQIDACRFTPAAIPLEDEPPSLVDADRMEAFKIAAQLFEVITGILIMSALEKSGPAFLVPGRANRDPEQTLALRPFPSGANQKYGKPAEITPARAPIP